MSMLRIGLTYLVILSILICNQIGWASPPLADEKASNDVWEKSAEDEGQGDDAGKSDWASETETHEETQGKKSPFQLIGKFRNKLAFDLKDDDGVEDDLSNHLQLLAGVKYVPHDRFHLVVSLNADYLQYKNGSHWNYDSTIRFDNAYLNWSSSAYNLKIGNQIVRWGKTDGYSPLDNLNPEDYRDGIAGRREDRKIPIPMVNLELYRGQFTLQGVYIPVFVKPELDTLETDWALFQHADQQITSFRIYEEGSSRSFRNTEGGLRIAGILGRVDYALSWFHGREDLPTPGSLILPPGFPEITGDARLTDLLLFSQLTGQTVILTHDRQNTYGFEFESTLGDFGVRGDVAYFDQSSFLTRELQRLRKPTAQCMLGLDYNSPSAWYMNLQYLETHIINYDSRILWTDEWGSAMTGTVSKEFLNGNLKPECRFYYDFSGNAALLNPKVKLKFWEPLIIEIGAELFDGSEETPVGIFGENDLLYVQFEAKF
jgi:hypothetical protein